ncbi:hypothetical protein BDV12DRAFT_174327 [Aspergillus spectabilis]
MSYQKVVLISGANRGLGYETARILLRSPHYHVIIGSRALPKGTAAVKTLRALPDVKGTVETIQLDVRDLNSINSTREYLEMAFERLDILIQNAAVYLLDSGSPQTLRTSLETNVIGVATLTETLLPLLRRSKNPRLVFVTSSNASLAYNSDPASPHGGTHATEYRVSKAALNMLLVQYHRKLEGITVLGVDPGFSATEVIGDADALRKMGAAEPEVGAEIIAGVARGDKDDLPGLVHGPQGLVPW